MQHLFLLLSLSCLLIMISASLPGGWAIPIVILFILSFPPVRPIFRVLGCHPLTICTTALRSRNYSYSLWRCLGSLDWIRDCCRWHVSWRIRELLVRDPSPVKLRLTQSIRRCPCEVLSSIVVMRVERNSKGQTCNMAVSRALSAKAVSELPWSHVSVPFQVTVRLPFVSRN